MNVIKRDGKVVPFNIDKIYIAIEKADRATTLKGQEAIKDFGSVKEKIRIYFSERSELENIEVEKIQDVVERFLMEEGAYDTAKNYILYRQERTNIRGNTTDNSILELLSGDSEYWNSENSNKDSVVVTTQRDYLAGIASTDISRRKLLPKDVCRAHDLGIIHQHDIDYMAQNALTNCFRGDTKFISADGVRPFCSYKDGEEVFVPTHMGEWKKAKVKCYGIQKLNKVTFKRGPWTEKTFYVTGNHRWILKDGKETTNLKVGDYLFSTPDISTFEWEDLSTEEKRLWCKGFAYGDGTTLHFATCDYTSIRLCGKKNKYSSYFLDAGYNVTFPPSQEGEGSVKIPNFDKNHIPELKTPDEFKIFTYGYLCADGHHTNVKGSNSKNEFRGIQVTGKDKCEEVYNLLNKSGYYVSSVSDLTNQSTNYGERTDTTYLFRFQSNQTYRNWKAINIEKDVQECEVWCLEVEDNHSFILEGGIVTGNCCLINLEDMLYNGTVVNGIKIDPQHKLLTGMTVATQIITAVASSQYGI